jgi:hypothetical protein
MTTEPNTTYPQYQVHRIDFLNNPALAGLPADFAGMGVMAAQQHDTGRKCTLLVDHDYALMALTAQQNLGDAVLLAPTALRWLRIGWPEEWGEDLNPSWIQIYPSGAQA